MASDRRLRLVFLGSGAFGLPTLRALAQQHDLLAIVSQPDKPAGRGSTLTPTPIAQAASQIAPQVPLIKPASVNTPEVREHLRALGADAWVVIAFGQKLGKSLLEGVFAINLHASLLPRWRGAAPINAAVLAGDETTGNSVITLADRMDAGLILAQSHRPIPPDATAGELHDALADDGPEVVARVLAAHAAGKVVSQVQDESLVTLAPKLSKADGWIDFSQGAEACRRRVHGLTPWPGVTVAWRGQPLKILRVAVDPENPSAATPGRLIDPAVGRVACGIPGRDSGTNVGGPGGQSSGGASEDGVSSPTLLLREVQAPGKRPMPWADFARGNRPTSDDILLGGPPTPTTS